MSSPFNPDMFELSMAGESMERRNLTPEQGRLMMEHWDYNNQRTIRPVRIGTYQQQMLAGTWKYRTEINVDVLRDGTCKLVNGYHRLTALATLPEDSDFRLPVRIIYTLMDNTEEIADHYGVIDTGGPRSGRDAIKAQNFAKDWNVSEDILVTAGAAGALIMTDFVGGRAAAWHHAVGRSIPARIQFLRDWEQEIRIADELLQQVTSRMRKFILRQPVVAVMLLNLRHTPEQAVDFWTSVITGENLFATDPEMVLRNYLMTHPSSKMGENMYARYVANCWNAYCRGDKILRTSVKKENAVDLIVIDGTNYTRTRRERERAERLEAQKIRNAQARKSRRSEQPADDTETEAAG